MEDLVDAMRQAIANEDWDRVNIEAELLTEEIIACLVGHRCDDLTNPAIHMERIYANIRAGNLAHNGSHEAAIAKGQIRQFTTLLNLVVRNNTIPQIDLSGNSPFRLIMDALSDGEKTIRQLAEITGCPEESVVKQLVLLGNARKIICAKRGTATVFSMA